MIAKRFFERFVMPLRYWTQVSLIGTAHSYEAEFLYWCVFWIVGSNGVSCCVPAFGPKLLLNRPTNESREGNAFGGGPLPRQGVRRIIQSYLGSPHHDPAPLAW